MTKSINISSCLDNPQDQLRNAFIHKDIDSFKRILEETNANVNLYDERNEKNIFIQILETKDSAAFITLCVDNGAELYERNSLDKCPIHHVIDSLSPENLKAFLRTYNRDRINVRYNSKNCLHLLLGILDKPDRSQNPDPARNENIAECIKILILNGCNINMPDAKLWTPFLWLLKLKDTVRQKRELLDFVEEHCQVLDIHTYNGEKILKSFKENFPNKPIPKPVEVKIDFTRMYAFLSNRKFDLFSTNFQQFKINETNKFNSQEKDQNNSNKFEEDCVELLHRAVAEGLENAVALLIEEGVDVAKKSKNSKLYGPAETACIQGNYSILEMLLKANPKPKLFNENQKNLLHLTTERLGMESNEKRGISYEKCFYTALKYANDNDINQLDEYRHIPLHNAARYRHDKIVSDLLEKGSYIGTESIFHNETPIDNMSKKSLETYLDGCITTKKSRYSNGEQEIRIDYKFLIPPLKKGEEFGPEIAPLNNIALNSELRPLIRHPVLSSFLFLKWSKLAAVFHFNLVMFSLFMASLIYYIVLCQTLNADEQQNSVVFNGIRYISMVCIVLLAFREIFQFILSPTIYYKTIINYFEVLLILFGIYFVFNNGSDDDTNDANLRFLRAVTILLATFEFLRLIGTLPYLSISTHMVILRKVAFTFFKFIIVYSIPIISFALSFYTLFGHRNHGSDKSPTNSTTEPENDEDAFNSFSYPGLAIIKTFVMLTGEFDASALALNRNGAYCLIFLLFVFLITIVLFNLLNALAIDDTHEIRQEGELVDFCERISILNKYERIILCRSSSWRWLKNLISVFPHVITNGEIIIHPNRGNDIFTYQKISFPVKQVTIPVENGNDDELQNLNKPEEYELENVNNNSSGKDSKENNKPMQLLSKLQKCSSGMDPKIMKKIRVVLEKRNEQKNDNNQVFSDRISSMESEIKILRTEFANFVKMQSLQKSES